MEAFDATRGFAMCMVWLSHFLSVYFNNSPTGWSSFVGSCTLIASPTFIVLSGIMIGMLTTNGDRRARGLRTKLADRALFLLLAGHVILVIATADYPFALTRRWFGPAFITDTIGISILVSLWLVPKVPAPMRVLAGLAAFAVSWTIVGEWHPAIGFATGLKEVLFGSLSYQYFAYSWAVVPWLSVYFAATGVGEILATKYRRGEKLSAEQLMLSIAVIAMIGGLVLRHADRRYHSIAVMHGDASYLDHLLKPEQKWPPGPAYLLFFGGAGVGVLWLMSVCERMGVGRALATRFALIGRCSLALFLGQAFVYYKVLEGLHLKYTPAWPLLFAVSVLPLYCMACVWDRYQLNRILSVGWGRTDLNQVQPERSPALEVVRERTVDSPPYAA